MKPTLLILAAGRGSRFGGAKQVFPMGPHGETIMEYSIYDALNNGFGQVVLVINKEVEKDTLQLVDKMTGAKGKVSFVYQDLYIEMIPPEIQTKRLKPWGTAHAIMSAHQEIKGNFAMINADDFYGAEAFQEMSKYLTNHQQPHEYSMVGYDLKNTLSLNGTVSRGISISNESGKLESIEETHGIHEKKGRIVCELSDGSEKEITKGLASMNFWGFQKNLFSEMNKQFPQFLKEAKDLTKDEFLIPDVIDTMIRDQKIEVTVLQSSAKWFGVTYKEDKEFAANSIQELVKKGEYPSPLWN